MGNRRTYIRKNTSVPVISGTVASRPFTHLQAMGTPSDRYEDKHLSKSVQSAAIPLGEQGDVSGMGDIFRAKLVQAIDNSTGDFSREGVIQRAAASVKHTASPNTIQAVKIKNSDSQEKQRLKSMVIWLESVLSMKVPVAEELENAVTEATTALHHNNIPVTNALQLAEDYLGAISDLNSMGHSRIAEEQLGLWARQNIKRAANAGRVIGFRQQFFGLKGKKVKKTPNQDPNNHLPGKEKVGISPSTVLNFFQAKKLKNSIVRASWGVKKLVKADPRYQTLKNKYQQLEQAVGKSLVGAITADKIAKHIARRLAGELKSTLSPDTPLYQAFVRLYEYHHQKKSEKHVKELSDQQNGF